MTRIIVDYLGRGKLKKSLVVRKNELLVYILIGFHPGAKEVSVVLKEEGAKAEILGCYLGQKGKAEIKTVQHHLAANTESNLLIRTVLFSDAVFNFHGLIRVEKKIKKVKATLKNNNLIVGEKAKVESEPHLEILANQVTCQHGVTVTKLNEETLFYLKSRGLPESKAKKILITGFLKEIINQVPDSLIQKKLTILLNKALLHAKCL